MIFFGADAIFFKLQAKLLVLDKRFIALNSIISTSTNNIYIKKTVLTIYFPLDSTKKKLGQAILLEQYFGSFQSFYNFETR